MATLKEIYEIGVKKGIETDPRDPAEVARELKQAQKEYDKLDEKGKKYFDMDRLFNPYSDTRILYGDPDTKIKGVLAGIDMEVGEVILADRLREKGEPVNLVLSHHPEGKALAKLHNVMYLQAGLMYKLGVPINMAESLLEERMADVGKGLMPLNHNRTVDAAKLLDMPLMSVHTPTDNLVTAFLTKLLQEKSPDTLGDIMEILGEVPEIAQDKLIGPGPKIWNGSESSRCGKIMVDMTGGTSGSDKAYAELSKAGIGTLVIMHMPEGHRKKAAEYNIRIVNAGHISNDSLGVNLFLDELEKLGVAIYPTSGLIRVSRAGKA